MIEKIITDMKEVEPNNLAEFLMRRLESWINDSRVTSEILLALRDRLNIVLDGEADEESRVERRENELETL